MAQLSKAARFGIITLAFTAGALVAVVALSSHSNSLSSNITAWRTIVSMKTVSVNQPITFRCEGFTTLLSLEFSDTNLDQVHPLISKKSADGKSETPRLPMEQRPAGMPGPQDASIGWRLPKGEYILRFNPGKMSIQPVQPVIDLLASPSATALTSNNATNVLTLKLSVHIRGGNVSGF